MSVFSRHNLLIAVMALLGITMVSCNNDNCSGNSNAIPLAAFYEGQSNVSVPSLTVYGIGAPNDSCIISETSATQVYLPLRLEVTSCQYVLDYNVEGIENDTISLKYDAIPYFESHECGAMYNFNITSFAYTKNVIDSIAIPNSKITNADVVSIKIYMQ